MLIVEGKVQLVISSTIEDYGSWRIRVSAPAYGVALSERQNIIRFTDVHCNRPRIDLANALIDRMKKLFVDGRYLTFDTKEISLTN